MDTSMLMKQIASDIKYYLRQMHTFNKTVKTDCTGSYHVENKDISPFPYEPCFLQEFTLQTAYMDGSGCQIRLNDMIIDMSWGYKEVKSELFGMLIYLTMEYSIKLKN